MDHTNVDRLADWLIRRGLEGVATADLLRLFCEKCGAAGLPVNRGLMFIDTLHPVHEGTIGEMDCFYSGWSTMHPEGFSDDHLAALRRLVPALGLAVKAAALARVAATLVDVYLGHDAGRRVLEGRIQRGVADRIEAVL